MEKYIHRKFGVIKFIQQQVGNLSIMKNVFKDRRNLYTACEHMHRLKSQITSFLGIHYPWIPSSYTRTLICSSVLGKELCNIMKWPIFMIQQYAVANSDQTTNWDSWSYYTVIAGFPATYDEQLQQQPVQLNVASLFTKELSIFGKTVSIVLPFFGSILLKIP